MLGASKTKLKPVHVGSLIEQVHPRQFLLLSNLPKVSQGCKYRGAEMNQPPLKFPSA